MQKTIAKAIVVPGKSVLSDRFESNFFPEVDMYIFFSEALYDTKSFSFKGIRIMHDRIKKEYALPELDDSQLNYISVDIKPDDTSHTYLSINRRCCPLSSSQKEFIVKLFDVDNF